MNAILHNEKTLHSIRRVNQAIEDIKQGKMVVMVDDEDRENEGDLVYASSFSTPQKVNFMASHAKGLICVAVSKTIANRLQLEPMVSKNDSSYETAFTISVDAKNATTGISASERDMTIKILADETSQACELVRPGHIFPLIAKEGGALVRIGHTEGSVDLCALAGLAPSAVICEIIKEDGTMARRPDLDIFCKKHSINMVYISDIVEYRMMKESLVESIHVLDDEFMGYSVKKYIFKDHLERQHTAYFFGELSEDFAIKFHTIMPDNELLGNAKKYHHLLKSIAYLSTHGGLLIFMQSDTHNMSQVREYGIGAQIIKYFGIKKIALLSDNEMKEFVGISGFELEITNHIKL